MFTAENCANASHEPTTVEPTTEKTSGLFLQVIVSRKKGEQV
jgi:hypothetical protein